MVVKHKFWLGVVGTYLGLLALLQIVAPGQTNKAYRTGYDKTWELLCKKFPTYNEGCMLG